jgi:hypothetical protein
MSVMCDSGAVKCKRMQVEGAGALQAMPSVIEQAVKLACSTLLSGAAHESLKSFFHSLPSAKLPITFESLREQLLQAGARVPRAAQRSCCECAAALCDGSADRVADTMRLAISELEKTNNVCIFFTLVNIFFIASAHAALFCC